MTPEQIAALRAELQTLHEQIAAAMTETQNGANPEALTTFESIEALATAQARYVELPHLIQVASFQLPETADAVVVTPTVAEPAPAEGQAADPGTSASGEGTAAVDPPTPAAAPAAGTTTASGDAPASTGAVDPVATDPAVAAAAADPAATADPAPTGAAAAAVAAGAGVTTTVPEQAAAAILAARPASLAHDVRTMVDGLLAGAQERLQLGGQTAHAEELASLRAQTVAGSVGGAGAMMAHQRPAAALAESIAGPVWDAFQNDVRAAIGFTVPYNVGTMAAAVNMVAPGQSMLSPERIGLPPMMRRTLFDIIPKQTNTRGVEVKVRILSNTGAAGVAAPTAQAAPMPESAYAFEPVSDWMEAVAEYTPFKLRDLQLDRALFVSTVEQALKNLDRKVEQGIARGDGTDPNIKGLMTAWSVADFAKPAGYSVWQYLVDSYYQVFNDHEAVPTHIVLHPLEFSKILTDTGMYGTGADLTTAKSNNTPIWSDLAMLFGSEISPIILSKQLDAADQGKALIGDFSMCTYYEYPELLQKMLPAFMYEIPTALPAAKQVKFAAPATAEILELAVTGTLIVTYHRGFKKLDLN